MRTQQAGVLSEPPKVLIQPAKPNYKKLYKKCWNTEAYRRVSPGENLIREFIEAASPSEGQSVIDWGCGTGRMALALHKHGLDVTLVDFAENCLDDHVRLEIGDRFIEHDLTKPISLKSYFGVCTDVLEHIPEDQIDEVLDNILENSRHCFFQISCVQDHFGSHPDIKGDKEREHLHVTVHDYQWWLRKFIDKGVIVHRSADLIGSCIFYLTGWGDRFNLDNIIGQLNVSEDEVIDNIRYAAKTGIPSMLPHEQQEDMEIMLLAGGPTLNDFENEIAEKRAEGMPMVTVNGSYNWAIERGLRPSLQCVIDSREFNSRFTQQYKGLTDQTKYIVSSAAHPSTLERIPRDRSYLWHVTLSDRIREVITELFGEENKDWFACPGGCTVTLRALCALRMLGFNKIHVYGLDGCLFPDRPHHAYSQEENDKDVRRAIPITVAAGTKYEKTFLLAPWMISQAQDFRAMVPRALKDAKLKLYGDGIITYMVETAAQLGGPVSIDS